VKLAGINRHEFDTLTGRADTAKYAQIDAELFKEANINYIRTSHYPPTKEFLDACDRIGIYVEVEAPFCWTRKQREMELEPKFLRYFMEPTAAMVEYHRNHPSVIIWSLSNESGYIPADKTIELPDNYKKTLDYCRKSDPSRPICFNNEWARDGGQCDIAILHYQRPPFTNAPHLENGNRPIILDEYWHIPTYQPTELAIDPGRREQWGSNCNNSNSPWNELLNTKNVVGAAIWAGIDEVFVLPDGKTTGYGPWGIIDVWRRKKPEWWIAKRAYSPVWTDIRQIDYQTNQSVVSIPVENRYSFTNLNELKTTWQVAGRNGELSINLAPLSTGQIDVPVGKDVPHGSMLVLRFFNTAGDLITANGIELGKMPTPELPKPDAGCPQFNEKDSVLYVTGDNFRIALNKITGDFISTETSIPLLKFPTIHATRKELGFVGNTTSPYTEYPDMSTRMIKLVETEKNDSSLSIIFHEQYKNFDGTVKWKIDKNGQGTVSFDYTYSGPTVPGRELGLRFILDRQCQTIKWKRRSQWDIYPEDHIGRPEGTAKAFRSNNEEKLIQNSLPQWPWYLDSTDRGIKDFRCTKFNIYQGCIFNSKGDGIMAKANADAHIRSSVVDNGVQFHLLQAGAVSLEQSSKLKGKFYVQIIR